MHDWVESEPTTLASAFPSVNGMEGSEFSCLVDPVEVVASLGLSVNLAKELKSNSAKSFDPPSDPNG